MDNRWTGAADTSVLAVFNDLLAAAQKAVTTQDPISAIKPQKGARPATLLILVDQILVALASPYGNADYR